MRRAASTPCASLAGRGPLRNVRGITHSPEPGHGTPGEGGLGIGPADGRVWGSPGSTGSDAAFPCGNTTVPRAITAPPSPVSNLPEGKTASGVEVARWGDVPGRSRGTSAFPPPSGRSPPHLRAGIRLRGPSPGPRSECVNTRLRNPPDLRCHLARHLPSPSVPLVTQRDCLSWDCPKIAPPSY